MTSLGLPPLYAFQTRDLMFIFRIFRWITPGIRSNILDLISETINLCLKHSTVNPTYLLEFLKKYLHSYAERTSLFVSKVTHQ